MAPGSLGSLYGSNLTDAEYLVVGVPKFQVSVPGVSVSVNGVNAPLLYVSPTQTSFQIPWETAAGPNVQVKVSRNGLDSDLEAITIAATTAPSMFLSEFTNGVAWVTGTGCLAVECVVEPGGSYQLWGNGFGPKNAPLQNGVPAMFSGTLTPLEVAGSPATWQLTIGGQPAVVLYCDAAPGAIIDQLNFVYPSGVVSKVAYVEATLTISGVTGRFRVPAPATLREP